jgi:hypothetical protein
MISLGCRDNRKLLSAITEGATATMNVPEYAKRRRVTAQAVRKAIASGRLVRSVARDERGRVEIDAAVADVEWNQRTDPQKIHTHRELFAPPAVSALDFPEATRRLTALVEADFAEVQRYVLELVPHAIEGAAEALRAARQRNPTEAEIALALRLDPEDEDAGIDVIVSLQEIVDGTGAKAGGAVELAREVGRAAAVGGTEASDAHGGGTPA